MKPEELCSGDWVLINGVPKKIQAVDGVDDEIMADDEIYCLAEDRYHSEDKVTGIPLTPEILEKNGFTKDEEIDQWYFKSNDRLDLGLFAVGIDDGCGTGLCVMRNGAITYYCKYVHELQHYLRLIGGAKEIEL